MAEKKTKKGVWTKYVKEGEKIVKKAKNCPKCGPGYTLSEHNDRLYCGACHYTEFQKTPLTGKKE